MSRPLLAKSVFELEQAVQRNQHHRAELGLIETELRHRGSQAARNLLARVRGHLSDLEKPGLRHLGQGGNDSTAASAAPAPKRGRPPLSLEQLSERIQDAWSDPGKLRQLRPLLERRADDKAAAELLGRIDARLGYRQGGKEQMPGAGHQPSSRAHRPIPPPSERPHPACASSNPEPKPMTDERR